MAFLTQIRKIRNFLVTSVLIGSLGGLFFISGQVWASTYGSGAYGDCKYSTSCPTSGGTNSTPTTTPTETNGEILLNDFPAFFSDSGIQLTLSPGQIIYFNVTTNGTTQRKSITIVAVGDNCVDITITLDSTNLNDQLCTGDTKQYDVNGDNKNDVQITLDRIEDGKAVMTFKALSGAPTLTPTKTAAALLTSKSKSGKLGLIVSIILILLAITIFFLLWLRRRKHKDKDGPFGPTPTSISPQPPLPPEPPMNQSPPMPQPPSQQQPFFQPPTQPAPSSPPAQPRTVTEFLGPQPPNTPRPPSPSQWQ